MKNLSPQQLLEIDRCFNWVSERIRIDKIPHQKVLFGSTVHNWFLEKDGIVKAAKIVIAGFPPDDNYEMAYLRVSGKPDAVAAADEYGANDKETVQHGIGLKVS